ncbi:transcriptional regulator with XRE-family HTH domain [Loktanella sp. PT4BL]|jgi:transcriptional regulator with XRE-family HTH domain|uniref:helix-turn-helix domain-containing protein n=1 Tax=Loktanella sp. PT4BL TaxID=2135611 RepID=UPI000D763E61|nr:helix-turn-helix transcriptional regulator [Loktanella sp. PT4BL]PXW65634.1 transcriptional regulator with XRE-family HTH domain [Loktanella sp. PT4BL]
MSYPVDIHVGNRIRQRRLLLNKTQQQVSDQVGVKSQQLQKYETGKNRVSASRLWQIAKVLDVPVSFFFDGLDHQPTAGIALADLPLDILNDKEALELLRAYYWTPEHQRRCLFDLARTLGTFD